MVEKLHFAVDGKCVGNVFHGRVVPSRLSTHKPGECKRTREPGAVEQADPVLEVNEEKKVV